jgi:energy-coupling factor transport system permease protein
LARGLSLYVEGRSPLHRAHPLTKGALTLAGIALAFIAPSLPWVLALGAALLLLLALAGVLTRFLAVLTALLIPIGALLVIVQGLVNPQNHDVLLPLGPLSLYRQGVLVGVLTAARLMDLIAATFLLSFTTRPADLAETLMQHGLSPRFGYVVQSVLQVIPQTLETVDRIRDAQQARGLEVQGRIDRRVRAFLPLMMPVVLSSLVATQERAMALEVRGFGLRGARVDRHRIPDSAPQSLLRWALLLLVPLAILARLVGWR